MNHAIRQYSIVTASYWAFTITDGALRMLVVLYFHGLGYSPFEIASLFVFYEVFGIVTNLLGGWLAARFGLNTTLFSGIALQVIALLMLAVDPAYLSVAYVMAAQALSGIAKDLNKMSAKSRIKLLIPASDSSKLYRWVALLTGSKNALKGAGIFLGGFLLALLGFQQTVIAMAVVLAIVLCVTFLTLEKTAGKSSFSPQLKNLLPKSKSVKLLSAARFFLFGSRDVWFVVALPVFLQSQLSWSHTAVSSFLAIWIIVYGLAQAGAPAITGIKRGKIPDGRSACNWAIGLCMIPALMAAGLFLGLDATQVLIVGLMFYGLIFALNSAIHSYLIVSYAKTDGVSLDMGFYYMANAAGRLTGTLLSGWIYQVAGLNACLLTASIFVMASCIFSDKLPAQCTQADAIN
ncbi:MAG: organoarsenical effux MFS transporter ArsJ [Porticoccaceae bacterium]|nr:organoarsenical effux MFS transporter ArsJ [Porticoccaceae bacterium]